MDRTYELDILPPAQAELEEIARIHLALSGAKYARNITDEIYAAMNQLTMFPLSGTPVHDEQLRAAGYRYTMAEKYLIFYCHNNAPHLSSVRVFLLFVYSVGSISDYTKYISKVDPTIPRAFIRSVVREIVVTDGEVESIDFQSGVKCIFTRQTNPPEYS